MNPDQNLRQNQPPQQPVSQALPYPTPNSQPASDSQSAVPSTASPARRPNHASVQQATAAGDLPPIQTPTEQQKQQFNLSRGEGIFKIVERHVIGLVEIYLGGALTIVLLLGLVYLFEVGRHDVGLGNIPTLGIILAVACLCVLAILATMVLASIYKKNKLVITNESIIIQKKVGLFGLSQQKVGLDTVDDISFKRQGLLQVVFNYGSVEVSAMGDKGFVFNLTREPRETAGYINNIHEVVNRRHRRRGAI